MLHRLLLAALLAAPALPAAAQEGPPVATATATAARTAAAAPPLLERVVVIGASVSGGYGLQPELKATVALGDVLDCALPAGGRAPTLDLGDIWLFRDPARRAPEMVEEALEARPTLVLAVDFLFWFGYTSWTSPPDRMADLERGLALLEPIDCPLVIGDFPDMGIAVEGTSPFGFPLIAPHMIPPPPVRERLNARVREWAAARDDVLVVPLGELVHKMTHGEAMAVRGNEWPQGAVATLLQEDLLHPRVEGVICLVVHVLDRMVQERDDLPGGGVEWSAAAIRECLMEATRSEREKALERERRRVERRRRREAEGEGDGGGESGGPGVVVGPGCAPGLPGATL